MLRVDIRRRPLTSGKAQSGQHRPWKAQWHRRWQSTVDVYISNRGCFCSNFLLHQIVNKIVELNCFFFQKVSKSNWCSQFDWLPLITEGCYLVATILEWFLVLIVCLDQNYLWCMQNKEVYSEYTPVGRKEWIKHQNDHWIFKYMTHFLEPKYLASPLIGSWLY